MAVARGSLRAFLMTAKSTLQDAISHQKLITLVIGNESADLDSITSALLFAYLKSNARTVPPIISSNDNHSLSSQYPPFYIPLLNIPRADIKIRPELVALLPYANIEPSHLITLDDLTTASSLNPNPNNEAQLNPKNTHLILTDHNKLAGPLATLGFSNQVIGCIDHHIDENTIPRNTDSEPRIITTAGSCTSLVTQYFQSTWDILPSTTTSPHEHLTKSDSSYLAHLALAPILIDTNSLQDKSKTTPTDISAVEYLESKIFSDPLSTNPNPDPNSNDNTTPTHPTAPYDRATFYSKISTAKSDLSSLTTPEILRKDYKSWTTHDKTLGISSIVKHLTWQIAKTDNNTSDFLTQVKSFADERGLDLYCLMTTSRSEKGEFQRELLLWSMKEENNKYVDGFRERYGKKLGLEEWKEVDAMEAGDGNGSANADANAGAGRLEVWWQRKVENSRKQVAPLLREVIEA